MSNLLNTQIVSVNQEVVNLPFINISAYGDAMTIDAVAYVDSLGDLDNIYLLWCSATQGYIASFVVNNGRAVILPKVTTVLKNLSNIQFKLDAMTPAGYISPAIDGAINITLTFTKYK